MNYKRWWSGLLDDFLLPIHPTVTPSNWISLQGYTGEQFQLQGVLLDFQEGRWRSKYVWEFSWAPGENAEPVVELKTDILFSVSDFLHMIVLVIYIKFGNKGQLTLLAVLSVISMFRVPANKRQNYHRLSQHITTYQFPQNSKKLPCFFKYPLV